MDNGGQAIKVKMSGYLYKKCKKRMMSSWKMYWFVLEDRLLLFYRSKDEYQAISPCKGSINLGPPGSVKTLPSVNSFFNSSCNSCGKSLISNLGGKYPTSLSLLPALAIARAQTHPRLKAENSEDQMKWLKAIMSALNQNQNFSTSETPKGKKLHHFRYSLDDLIPEREPNDSKVLSPAKVPLERQNTMPDRIKLAEVPPSRNSNEIIQRLQKIGAHSYGGSLGAISKMSFKKPASPKIEEITNEQDIVPVLRPTREVCDNIYERISGDSNSSQLSSNRTSFVVDNENYSVPIRKSCEKFSKDASNIKSVIVENDQYMAVPERSTDNIIVENDQYVSNTRKSESLVVENDQYITSSGKSRLSSDNDEKEEVIYAEPKTNEVDHNKNSVVMDNCFYAVSEVKKDNENLYEELDKEEDHYSRPIFKNGETSSHSSDESKPKTTQKKTKSKKSKSFIKRVWKKKNKKSKEESVEDEEIYEVVDLAPVEKIEYTDESKVQMLSELQNILEQKKPLLKKNVSNASTGDEEVKNEPSTSNSDVCPTLPPKTQKMQTHDKNQPIEPEKLRSLDEILEDLDREKFESKNKVKMLIEKFSEPESDDVVLRKHDRPDFNINRHSDDLNKLLNELAKVTSAPIMTPGVTSSLVNPNLTDEEWMRLLPVRQRRMSEPDYDVPRPHKSIQLPAKPENSENDAIPATRFFGPALPPTITDNAPKEDSLCVSMTPDSLEVEEQQKSPNHCSYTSHNYYQNDNPPVADLKCFSHNYKQDDKIIYAMPKSYLSVATHIVNTCQNICSAQLAEECTIIYKNVKNVEVQEEIFKDSLELCHE